jgi:hypothetical protein
MRCLCVVTSTLPGRGAAGKLGKSRLLGGRAYLQPASGPFHYVLALADAVLDYVS